MGIEYFAVTLINGKTYNTALRGVTPSEGERYLRTFPKVRSAFRLIKPLAFATDLPDSAFDVPDVTVRTVRTPVTVRTVIRPRPAAIIRDVTPEPSLAERALTTAGAIMTAGAIAGAVLAVLGDD